MDQAISRRPATSEARVRSHTNQWEIFGRLSRGQIFFSDNSVFTYRYDCFDVPHLSSSTSKKKTNNPRLGNLKKKEQ